MGSNNQNYSEKLRNPLWQRKRLQVFDRDNWTCQLCSDDSTELHVHHISYEPGREPWEYDMDNFTTLCKHCHGAVTIYRKDYNGPILKADKRKVPIFGYYAILLLVQEHGQLVVAVLTASEKHIDLISVISQDAIANINELIKTDITNLKTV